MLRSVFLLAFLISTFAWSLIGMAQERPNILFIMSDDHTAQAVGAYATLLKDLDPTPNIDTLAAEGICFENAFCTNAICTPSRACIITGQYDHINGVFDLGGSISPDKQALPIVMRNAGYQTAMIGKWHLKVEPNGCQQISEPAAKRCCRRRNEWWYRCWFVTSALLLSRRLRQGIKRLTS